MVKARRRGERPEPRPPAQPAQRVAAALAHLAQIQRREKRRLRTARAPAAATIERCEPLARRTPPEYQFTFRLPFELLRIADLPLAGLDPPLTLACVPIRAGRLSLAADLRYAQTWAFQRLFIGDLASSISLAPAEKLTLTIRKTQRTQLTETTLRSSESLESTESTIVDKDVLNIQRSMARSMQWHVDHSSSVTLWGIWNIGGSAGLAGSTQSTSNTVVEQLSEATEKSVRQVQTLTKVEVARQSELAVEEAQVRTIENPYRDRAITLNVYELAKQFSVATALAEIRPAVVLEITDLELGRDFVLAHGEFLDASLLDRSLAAELREALAAVRTPLGADHRALARRYARMAFHFLFEAGNVFNLDNANAAENDPWLSFADDQGFDDARSNEAGRIFMTLGTYLRVQAEIYSRPPFGPAPLVPLPPPWPGPGGRGHDLEVEMAVALAGSIEEEWKTLPPDRIDDLTDTGDRTEVLRRVPGFLSLVNGLIKPLLKPIEEERAAADARNRAEEVIDRVIAHLGCNKAFYVERFLEHVGSRSRNYALGDVYSRILRSGLAAGVPPNQVETTLEFFNPRLGFLDGFQFVVPLRFGPTLASSLSFIETITGVAEPLVLGGFVTDTRDLLIPTDGFHIEPIPGVCVLPNVPAPASSASANISVNATGP